MQAGALRRRVTFEQRVTVQNPDGEPVKSWVAWRTVWASLRPMSGYQYMQASGQAVEAKNLVTMTIRYLPGIDQERMRVRHVLDIYEIEAVLHRNEGRREMQVMLRQQI